MRRRAALLMGLMLVAAACGTDGAARNDPTVTYLPATTMFTGSFPTVPLTAPSGVPAELERGQSWCPSFRTPAEGSGSTDYGVAERNLGVLMAYGARHPVEAGSPWFDAADDEGRVVMGFTADVAGHRDALRPMLADPDRVVVCQVLHSAAEVAAAVAEMDVEARAAPFGVWRNWSAGTDRAHVTVRADQRELADALLSRYGDLVELRLGLFPHPMPEDPGSLDGSCRSWPSVEGARSVRGVVARVSLARADARSGADVEATVTLTNEGTETTNLSFGAPQAVVVRPGTVEVVGVSDLGATLALDSATVAPGRSETRPVTVGTASCDAEVGPTLPPGDYEVLVLLAGRGDSLVSEPTRITLTA